jgi:glycerophosphoryl diester phosphodiesterase
VAAAGAPRNLYPGSPWLGEAAWHASKLPPPMAVAGLGGQVWAPAESDLTPDLVETAHRAGLQVFAWTVNRAETALKLGNWGVDALITDYPEEIARLFSQAGAAEE